MTTRFSSEVFKFLSLVWAFSSLITMSLCVDLLVFFYLGFIELLKCVDYFLIKFGKFLEIISSNILSAPFLPIVLCIMC